MRKIKLYGELGKKFGDEYLLDVNSPSEAMRALSVQIPGFEKYLLESEKNGVGFKVFDGDIELTEKEIHLFGSGDIKIVPVISGANGESRILIGAAIIGAVFVATGGIGGVGMAGAFTGAGTALALGGVVEVLTRGMVKQPTPYEKPDNRPSYAFSGAVNTTAQGQPVPIGYGKLIVGGEVISASLSTKSIMAGYKYVTVNYTRDVKAYNAPENLSETPPVNFYKREIISSGSYETWGDGGYTTKSYFIWRYYYSERQLQLVTV